MSFIEKHSKIALVIIFLVGILIYGFVASKMTNTPYLDGDEELYVSMARSFFFEHNFSKENVLLNYKCVIYSMIISIAYIFGTGFKTVFLMRFIGVCFIMSPIFPIYLLSNEILKDKKKSLIITMLSIFIPEFTLSFYLIQEVICYPVFLWIVYLVYIKFTKENTKTTNFLLPVLFGILYFIKSYAIVFGISYFITLGLITFKEKN